MTIQQYQEEVKKTLADLQNKQKNLLHMEAGVVTELAEVLDILKKNIAYGKPIDFVHVKEELGDICYYVVGYSYFDDINLENLILDFPENLIMDTEDLINFMIDMIGIIAIENWHPFEILRDINFLCEWMGLDFSDILETNIKKLKARYPNGEFNAEQAINRNVQQEERAWKIPNQ